MVGGDVVDVVLDGEKVWVNCREPSSGDTCAIYVVRDERSEIIDVGDRLWWQGRTAFWTPLPIGGSSDIPLKRVGYSGVLLRPAGGTS